MQRAGGCRQHNLRVAQVQVVVAVPVAHAPGGELVESVVSRHHGDSGQSNALALEPGERAPAFQRVGRRGVHNGRHAHRGQPLARQPHARVELVRRAARDAAIQVGVHLQQQPRWFARGVPRYHAFHRVGRVGVYADVGERGAVEHAGMAAAMRQSDGDVSGGGVEVAARGMAAFQQGGLVVAAPYDPRAGGRRAGALGDCAAQVGDCAGGVRAAIYVAQAGGVGHQVHMRIDEAGHERAAAAIDRGRVAPIGAGEFVVADPGYHAAAYADRRGAGPALVQREDVGVSQGVAGLRRAV